MKNGQFILKNLGHYEEETDEPSKAKKLIVYKEEATIISLWQPNEKLAKAQFECSKIIIVQNMLRKKI